MKFILPVFLWVASLSSVLAQSYYIGQHTQGGIVFHVFQDSIGTQHGLVVSLSNLTREAAWGDKEQDIESCESTWDGRSNTTAILFATRDTTKAAGVCDAYVSEGFDDWYLPAIYELQALNSNLYTVGRALSEIPYADAIEMNLYWSSTESNAASAWFFSFYDSKPTNYYDKTSKTLVRAVRSF
ncbi:MAG: DUF1566 domain-containing protein [Flavobacteriales bacterium]